MKQQKTKPSFSRQATYWLGVIAVGLTVGLGIQFAQAAWTNPSAGAPNGNVAGPVTVGNTGQWKTGPLGVNLAGYDPAYGLTVGGGIKANSGNIWGAGAVIASTEIIACAGGSCSHLRHPANNSNYLRGNTYFNGVLYDENNIGYYLDPNNGSRLNALGANYYHSYGNVHADGNMDARDYYIANSNKWASQLVGRPILTRSYQFQSFCGSSGSTNPHSFCAMTGVYQHGNNGLLRLIPGAPDAQGRRVYTLSVTRPTGCSDGALHLYVDCFDF